MTTREAHTDEALIANLIAAARVAGEVCMMRAAHPGGGIEEYERARHKEDAWLFKRLADALASRLATITPERDGGNITVDVMGEVVKDFGSSRASTSSPPNGDPEGWRLIESAPRDGTPFLGANFSVHRRDGGRPTRIWWQPEFAVGDETGWISGARVMVMAPGYTYGGKTEHMHSPERFAPTHWMPLPADGLLGATTDASSPNGRNLNPSSPPPPTGLSEG